VPGHKKEVLMRAHHAIVIRQITLAFLLLYFAAAGLGATGTTGSAQLGIARANPSGAFSLSASIPANIPQGTLNVVASGVTSHLSSSAPITIGALPAGLTLSSWSVRAGDTVGVLGKGFIPGETVSIQLTGGSLTPLTLATVVANTQGSFSIAKLVIPTLVPAGSFTLTASGQTSGRACVQESADRTGGSSSGTDSQYSRHRACHGHAIPGQSRWIGATGGK
jgi:hypothetical protein